MREKILLLGFTVEGFEQVDAYDPFEDDNSDGDDDLGDGEEKYLDDIQEENLSNSNNGIDEMDKANVTVQPAPEKSIKKTSVGSEYL